MDASLGKLQWLFVCSFFFPSFLQRASKIRSSPVLSHKNLIDTLLYLSFTETIGRQEKQGAYQDGRAKALMRTREDSLILYRLDFGMILEPTLEDFSLRIVKKVDLHGKTEMVV